MIASVRLILHSIALTLAATVAMSTLTRAEDATGTFMLVSDIHFDPFDTPDMARALAKSDAAAAAAAYASAAEAPFARVGEDTNASLLGSALAAITKAGAAADFAIIQGDTLSHNFERKAEAFFGVTERSDSVRALAVETTLFVANAIGNALPGKPIIVALGNTDSECGDYRIESGGSYLAQTRETVRRLVGTNLVDDDFNDTYMRGGWYAARHPTAPKTRILVINDILWSTKYQDACGSDGHSAGEAMMTWLTRRLADAKSARELKPFDP
jgi:hypothetical protein